MGAEEEVPEVATDPRMDFLEEYTVKTLRLKPEKWKRLISINDEKKRIFKLIDCPDCKGCTTGLQDEHNNCIQVL